MLWTSANKWGLAGDSSNPGGIEEAQENLRIVSTIPKEVGGNIGMIMAWDNVRTQNFDSAKKQEIFNNISSKLSALKSTLSGGGGGVEPIIAREIDANLYYEKIGQELPAQFSSSFSVADVASDFATSPSIYLISNKGPLTPLGRNFNISSNGFCRDGL